MTNPAITPDAGRFVGDALAGTVRAIGRVHMSISGRTFDAIGEVAAPVRVVHDGLTRSVYATVAGGHAVAPRAAALASAARARRSAEDEPSEESHSPTLRARALGALNGLKGDLIAAEYPELAFPMSLRDHVNGGDVASTPDGLAAAYPDATGRVAVFIHGLCETDRSWWDGSVKHHDEPSVSYGSMLEDDLDYTPAYLRYNSGLPIAENGRMLAELIDEVVLAWPVPVDDLVLIGHSMGGLVARSACHQADVDRRGWAELVSHVICIGTPHLGAPLARAVHRVVPQLDRFPETRPLAELLRERSAAVKDLRHGVFVPDESLDDDLFFAEGRIEVPFLNGAAYWFVGATITGDRHHRVGRLAGDLLVTYPSASGANEHRRIPFEPGNGVHVGGINHFDLLNHPTVYEHLRRWLTPSVSPGSEI